MIEEPLVVGTPLPCEDMTPLATDTVLILRDGMCHLRGPKHDPMAHVPEDFLVVLGVAHLFKDDSFRTAMMAIVRAEYEAGHLDDILQGGTAH